MNGPPIAIVGMACRFPGGATPAEFWQLLLHGRNASADIPAHRWPVDRFFDPDPTAAGKMVTRRAALVDDIDSFDAAFFGVAPREAVFLDPQQRMFLEVVWEAFEDAGMPADDLSGQPVGCFVGAASAEHAMCILEDTAELEYFVPGSAYSVIAHRVSYFFNFCGPSLAIDTACSSALAAIHLACQSLQSGESTLALAGATHALVSPWGSVAVSKMGLLAPDGYCKAFDARADGLGRGEGAGVVLLKPLERALADGDRIRAVIKGSAVNQNGRGNGLYAPNPIAQEAVVRAACRAAGIAPGEIDYVEAHGTGTPLGDAIEMKALGAALTDGRPPLQKCLVGSVKTNIGHLDAAAGISGVVKTVLALENGVIPAHLNFQTPSPAINFARLPLSIPSEATPWPIDGKGLAGVHAFGLGGANAHVILQRHEAPATATTPPELDTHVLGISAKSEAALRALCARYAALFERMPDDAGVVADACYSAGVGRARMTHRVAIVATRPADFARILRCVAEGAEVPEAALGQCRFGRPPRIGFLISEHSPATSALTDRLRIWGIVPHVTQDKLPDPPGNAVNPTASAKQPDVWIELGGSDGVAIRSRTEPSSAPSTESRGRSAPWIAAELFVRGAPIDWKGLYHGSIRRKVDLPFYPFQRERYTLLDRYAKQPRIGAAGAQPSPINDNAAVIARLRNSTSSERPELVAHYVDSLARSILRVTDVAIDAQIPLLAMGFDSIMSTELMNALKRDFALELPVAALLDGIALQGVCEMLCEHLATPAATLAHSGANDWDEGEL